MHRVTNISAYRFAPLRDLKDLRAHLLAFCSERGLKGTILLAPEGINLFVAGRHQAVEELVYELRQYPGLADLLPKYSESDEQPFSRMLVRLKKEIIAFGVEGIDPADYTSPRLKPVQLKRWLDGGRPVVLLDTRNDYEVRLGTFRQAKAVGIDHFRDFPKAVESLPEDWKNAPVVTFCTGGIRCEKAAPLLERMGFNEVYQLDGGILKYFEDVGGDHFEGECFVFDQRVGVDPALRETGSKVCFACQTPLTAEEAADPRHVPGESCPYCYRSSQEKRGDSIRRRQRALRAAADPLPGRVPYDNRKPIRIPGRWAGEPLLEALDGMMPHVGRNEWIALFAEGRLLDPRGVPAPPGRTVKAGEEYLRLLPGTLEPEVNGEVRVLDEDEALIVVDKPAPLPMHPCGRFNRNTLEHLLRVAWHPEVPRPAHRLDANTSGLVVCARTRHFAKRLQPQFAGGEVAKRYLARVHGHPSKDRFTVAARISAEACELGAREIDEADGLEARTDFRVLRRDRDGTSLLLVRPRTGRTNQIRVHLWEAGHPIVGDPVYLEGGRRGERQTLSPGDPPMCLHAWKLAFRHPLSGERVRHVAPVPSWAGSVAADLEREEAAV